MQRTKSKEREVRKRGSEGVRGRVEATRRVAPTPLPRSPAPTVTPLLYALSFMLLALCFLHGCSAISPPVDYYQQVLDMEEHGEQTRRDTGRHPGEIVAPARDSEPIRVAKSPVYHLTSDVPQEQTKEVPVVEQKEETQARLEEPPRREVVQELSPSSPPPLRPIALSPDVIKGALESANLGVSVRTVELVNGRLSGGKNSVRVSFLSESMNVIDDKFVAICAVIYHLNHEANSIDLVVGIAEDKEANLLAILQSNMSDIEAWITNELSRMEWFSRVTIKTL